MSILPKPFATANAVVSALTTIDHRILCLRLTLLLVVLYASNSPWIDIPLRVSAGLLLICPTLLTEPLLWWFITAAVIGGNIASWYEIDNHRYLIGYLVLACTVSLHTSRNDWLRETARLLIGFAFAFAVLWKIAGGEFVNGHFLYFTFLSDPRLAHLSATLSSTPVAGLRSVHDSVQYAASVGLTGVNLPLPQAAIVRDATLVLSWFTVALEGAIAAMYLAGGRLATAHIREYTLMVFIVLTYFLLPVPGFAFVLAILCLASCQPDDMPMRLRILGVLALVQLTVIPWHELLLAGHH